MKSEYKMSQNTWLGLSPYNLNGTSSKEMYGGPVTLSLPQWHDYVSSGVNTLLGSGGVIPGGTMNTPGGESGAVYKGHVRQGWGM